MTCVKPCDLLNRLAPLGMIPLRLALGVVFIAHGADKLWGVFGGGGIHEVVTQFSELGIQPAGLMAWVASASELLGGLMVLTGGFARLGALLIAGTMVVAIVSVHWSGGLFARDGGFEYPLVILGGALLILLQGSGPFSLDSFLPVRKPIGKD